MRFPGQAKFLAALLSVSVVSNAAADMAAGIAAYSRGDYASALHEFHAAGKQDNPRALNLIAIMYAEGQGVERDYKKAADWFFKAQALGSLEAMANLGRMYSLGLGVPRNDATALKLLRDAALGGYRPAMLRLADIYEKGELGLAADLAEAKSWRARAGGGPDEYFDLRRLPPPIVQQPGVQQPGLQQPNKQQHSKLQPDEKPASRITVPPEPLRKPAAKAATKPQPGSDELFEKQVLERLEKYGKRERKLIVASTDRTAALSAYLEGLRLRLHQLLAGEFKTHSHGMTITISVLQDGSIRTVELDKGSGDAALDQKILSRIGKSGNMQPLPAAARELADVLEVTVKLPIE